MLAAAPAVGDSGYLYVGDVRGIWRFPYKDGQTAAGKPEKVTSNKALLFIGGGALVTVGALLWMKRRDYRTTQAGYDPRAIDE